MGKASPYITAVLVFFVILFGLLILQNWISKEGFQNASEKTRYEAVVSSLGKLKPFQTLQKDVKQTLLEGIREQKEPGSLGEPNETLRKVYLDGMGDEPMDTSFFDLPPWSNDTEDLSISLSGVPDSLNIDIWNELAFYKKKLDELGLIFSNLKDPSTFQIPKSENSNSSATLEGFADNGKCSAESARLAREALRKKRLAEQKAKQSAKYPPKKKASPEDCKIRPLPEELTRVETILSNMDIDALAEEIRKVGRAISKFREDFQKLKDGTLYDWQKAGSKKSYAEFKGKSNGDGLLFSIQQAGAM